MTAHAQQPRLSEQSETHRITTVLAANLKLIECGGQVVRYHTVMVIKPETVAAHSYAVAWISKLLSPSLPRVELLLAGLQHDQAEYITGDMPGPTKINLKISHQFDAYEKQIVSDHLEVDYASKLSKEELRILSASDAFAGLLYCTQERAMGNRFITECYDNYLRYTKEIIKNNTTPQEHILLAQIERRWLYATTGQ